MISERLREAINAALPLYDAHVAGSLVRQWSALPKPPASLGRLEDLAVHYGIVRGTDSPTLSRKGLYCFFGLHGVVEEGVTTDAGDATARQLTQLARGGAPVNVLCRQYNIETIIVAAGMSPAVASGPLDLGFPNPAANITRLPAMTVEEVTRALEAGLDLAADAAARFDVVGLAQFGSGGSTAASSLLASITGRDPGECSLRTPDLPDSAWHRKVAAVRAAVGRHSGETITALGALRCLGGFEIAVMTGFLLGAAGRRLPVMVDGFVSGAAALVARGFAPDSLDAAIFAHDSGDPAHGVLHATLGVEPQLHLDLRADSGCAAALVIHLLDTSLRLLRETAAFD
jgi:nicotinate-nucleotide--dimethylbenzimidazole phosphoribosyltransferase